MSLTSAFYTPAVNTHKPEARAVGSTSAPKEQWAAHEPLAPLWLQNQLFSSVPWAAWMRWITILWSSLLCVTKQISHSLLRMKVSCQDYSS